MKAITLFVSLLGLAASIGVAHGQFSSSAGSAYSTSSSSGYQSGYQVSSPAVAPTGSAAPSTVQASDSQRDAWLRDAENLPNAETIGEGTTTGPISRVGGNIITKGEVDGPISLFSGNLFVVGRVHGPVSVVGGNATILGDVDGPVSVVGGDLRVAGRVSGGTSVVGGKLERTRTSVILGSTSSVGGPFSINTHDNRWPRPFGFWRNSGGFFLWHCILLVLWTGVSAVAALLMPNVLDTSARKLAADPLRTGAIGFLVWIVFGFLTIVCVILCFFLIGIPMLGILFLAGIAIAFFGNSVVFLWVGRLLCTRFRWSFYPEIFPIVAGALIFSLLRFIPVIGFLIWLVVCLLGSGIAIVAIQHYRSLRPSLPPFAGPTSPFTGTAAPFGAASPFTGPAGPFGQASTVTSAPPPVRSSPSDPTPPSDPTSPVL